jgi:hypothetical protein
LLSPPTCTGSVLFPSSTFPAHVPFIPCYRSCSLYLACSCSSCLYVFSVFLFLICLYCPCSFSFFTSLSTCAPVLSTSYIPVPPSLSLGVPSPLLFCS